MPLLLDRQPTIAARHPSLFAIETWADLIQPTRRRRCTRCRGYLWLDLEADGTDRPVCSLCGREADAD